MMSEIYKDIIGYEGMYQISNMGNVKSLDRYDNKGRVVHGRILVHKKDGGGYHQVCLTKGGTRRYPKIHRLVCEAFLPNPEKKPTVNHKDENKDNNRLDNLEWATYAENAHYGTRIERCYSHRDYQKIGKKIAKAYRDKGRCRSIVKCDINGVPLKEYAAIVDASKDISAPTSSIHYAIVNKNVYKGFIWRYKEQIS